MKPSYAQQRERFMQLALLPVAVSLGRFRAEILYWGFFEPKWWRNYLHTHSFFEICYAYTGEGVFRMRGEDQKVRRGDLFIATPGQPHEIISSRKKPLGIYFWAHTLVPGTTRRSGDAIDGLLEAFAASTTWVARAPRSIAPTLQMLEDEASSRRPGYPRAIESLVSKLMLDTARAVTPRGLPGDIVSPPAAGASDAIVRTTLQYLRDNFGRPIGLRDIAAQVHVSERHLSRLFMSATGTSVIDQLIAIRMDAAKQMLLDREQPIKNIASAVGYPDVRYFITLFGKQTGTTPARWRATGGTRFLKRK
jgi:AraC family L-rhamnose operon transcriptional activator RhaR